MIKISGLPSLLRGKQDESQTAEPRQFGEELPSIVPTKSELQAGTASDPLTEKRIALKHLQDARAGLLADYHAKQEIADKSERIAADLKERRGTLSGVNDEIDAFYQQEIEASLTTDGHTALSELPEHLATRKRELDGLERQIIVTESCAERRREEARTVRHELEELAQSREDALQRVMSYVAEIEASRIRAILAQYVETMVSLSALTRQQFHQCNYAASS
ncbi:hypothetical protein AA0472_1277 [Acetobacter estunensis NRIC 0472]|uniref:Uncharacterized protein n=1 Tax=Acetobacter estunensis TaxID=104097 RepID=A0A967EIG6_9PROT|nr:hypothetical protein [Acetobacter estunensis]NHO55432.1 hypothetical protein [Acetobacter estunensis]GBQ24000.1 hypothetical protein AA0472_1277 [Acetobacter estunensis NRIC 0472]